MTPGGITRKLIVILSGDMKDCTRLINHDDGGTIRTLNEYREAMETPIKRCRSTLCRRWDEQKVSRGKENSAVE